MKQDNLLSRISIDPEVCFGKPCIKGHRIWVSLVLNLLASGKTPQDILDENLGKSIAQVFTSAGHDVATVYQQNMCGIVDKLLIHA